MSVAIDTPVSGTMFTTNLGFLARPAGSTHSPILSRSKSPRRCPLESSVPTCASAKPKSAEKLHVQGRCLSALQSTDNCHQVFPHFQPPVCHEICKCQRSPFLNRKVCASVSNSQDWKANRAIFPRDLVSKLSSDMDAVLVIDCRSFIAYNLNHIKGALNVSCSDRLTKKRLQCNKVKVGDLVSPGQEAKDEFSEKVQEGNVCFVLYDDDTEDLTKVPANSPLTLVLHSLHRDGIEAMFLKGGLSGFQSQHGSYCVKPQTKPAKTPLFSPTTPIIHSEIDSATISEILPFLFIGNERDSADREKLKELGITHILNVTSHLPLHFEGEVDLTYCRLSASDSAHQNLTQYFEKAFNFIEEARQQNGKVMIHCQAGVSRSSTLVIAYIMKHSQMTMSSAFHFVKSKRAIIAPNFNFMGQLMDFERQLNQGTISRDLAAKLSLRET